MEGTIKASSPVKVTTINSNASTTISFTTVTTVNGSFDHYPQLPPSHLFMAPSLNLKQLKYYLADVALNIFVNFRHELKAQLPT